ncbi:unnamed protein product [Orchesella dallaii]|uniref:Gustatory receptor n=1 Tax=Orchesella dallaii TaxID=48710 RepID=A0ABP1R2Y9_9HEXA
MVELEDSEQFVFPFYFKTVINVYFSLISCPFYFTQKNASSPVGLRTLSIQKCICCLLQISLLIFGIVGMSTLTFINLKKHPSMLFIINNEVISLLMATTAIYTLWFKQSEMKSIANIRTKAHFSSRRKLVAFIIALIFPFIKLLEVLNIDILNASQMNVRLYTLLSLIYIKPVHVDIPKVIELKTWEKVLGFFLHVIQRCTGLFRAFTLTMVLIGGLAAHEINARLLDIIKEKETSNEFQVSTSFYDILNYLQAMTIMDGLYTESPSNCEHIQISLHGEGSCCHKTFNDYVHCSNI